MTCNGNCNQGRTCYCGEQAKPAPTPPKCQHDWPDDQTGQTDMDGACTKCGMSFQRHIHMECP